MAGDDFMIESYQSRAPPLCGAREIATVIEAHGRPASLV